MLMPLTFISLWPTGSMKTPEIAPVPTVAADATPETRQAVKAENVNATVRILSPLDNVDGYRIHSDHNSSIHFLR